MVDGIDSTVVSVLVVDTETCWYGEDWSLHGLLTGRYTEVLLPWMWAGRSSWCRWNGLCEER
jgi:hypothetical protein